MIFAFPFSEVSHFYQQARGDQLTLALRPCLPPQYITSLYASGPTVSMNSSNPFAKLPSAPRLLLSIYKIIYSFYTGLLEGPTLRSGWLEALGDLARYRTAVAAMVGGGMGAGGVGGQSTSQAVSEVLSGTDEGKREMQTSYRHKITNLPLASTIAPHRVLAARLMDVEPEKERWRQIAREWYGAGLAEQPGTGKLHPWGYWKGR